MMILIFPEKYVAGTDILWDDLAFDDDDKVFCVALPLGVKGDDFWDDFFASCSWIVGKGREEIEIEYRYPKI